MNIFYIALFYQLLLIIKKHLNEKESLSCCLDPFLVSCQEKTMTTLLQWKDLV